VLRGVLITGVARSGTSLATRIFHEHGLWVGNLLPPFHGYQSYENEDIQRLFRKGIEPKTIIKQLAPKDERWVIKRPVADYEQWRTLNPYLVITWRNTNSIKESTRAKRGDNRGAGPTNQMKALKSKGVPCVDYDELLKGKYSSVRNALTACHIEPDTDIIENCIDKSLQRF